jgi:hypothetical protein
MSSGPRTLRPAATKLTVEWVRSESEIAPDVWNRCFPLEVEGRWWYKALELSGLQDQFQFYYAVVYANGPIANGQTANEPIAIAPCFVMDIPLSILVPENFAPFFSAAGSVIPSFKYQRTFSIGSPCADEGTVGVSPGHTLSDVATVLQKSVEQKARSLKAAMIAWKDFPGETWAALRAVSANNGMFEMVSLPGAVVEFSHEGGAETYYKDLKASRRQKIMKKLRSSKAEVDVQCDVLQRPDEAVRIEIFNLFWQTYEKGKMKFEKLTPAFFAQIAEADESWFILLRESKTKELVAFMLCFKVGNRVINKFIGLDYKRPASWFLYFRLWDEAIRWCGLQKAADLQSGQTSYSAKIELGHKLVPLSNFCKHLNPIMNAIYEHVAKSVSWETLDDDLKLYLKKYPV